MKTNSQPMDAGKRRALETIYHKRGLLLTPLWIIMLFVFYKEYENHYLIWPLGISLIIGAGLLRMWAQAHIRNREILKTKRILTTSGPYHYVRNPLYISNILILAGASILSELIWFLPFVLLYSGIIYGLVARREEIRLEEAYGKAYLKYKEKVPRWIPRISTPPAAPAASRPLFTRRVLIAEYSHFLVIVPFLLKEMVGHLLWGCG